MTQMMIKETYMKFGEEEQSPNYWKYKECEFFPDAVRDESNTVTEWGEPFRFTTSELVQAYCIPSGDDFLGEEGLS